MKLKRIFTALVALMLVISTLLALASCTKPEDEIDGLIIDCNNTKKSMSYSEPYTYTEYYDFSVNGTINIDVTVVTSAGGLGAAIYRKDMYNKDADIEKISIYFLTIKEVDGVRVAEVKNGSDKETVDLDGNYTDRITIASDGEYVLRVDGFAHNGSFTFDW